MTVRYLALATLGIVFGVSTAFANYSVTMSGCKLAAGYSRILKDHITDRKSQLINKCAGTAKSCASLYDDYVTEFRKETESAKNFQQSLDLKNAEIVIESNGACSPHGPYDRCYDSHVTSPNIRLEGPKLSRAVTWVGGDYNWCVNQILDLSRIDFKNLPLFSYWIGCSETIWEVPYEKGDVTLYQSDDEQSFVAQIIRYNGGSQQARVFFNKIGAQGLTGVYECDYKTSP